MIVVSLRRVISVFVCRRQTINEVTHPSSTSSSSVDDALRGHDGGDVRRLDERVGVDSGNGAGGGDTGSGGTRRRRRSVDNAVGHQGGRRGAGSQRLRERDGVGEREREREREI